jgi:chaperonin GroES
MKLQPLGNRVLVERIEPEETRKGGIIIPDTAKEKPQQGKIIAVGPGAVDDKGNRRKMEVKTGNKVLFSKYGGTEVTIDDVEYLIMGEDDILGLVG